MYPTYGIWYVNLHNTIRANNDIVDRAKARFLQPNVAILNGAYARSGCFESLIRPSRTAYDSIKNKSSNGKRICKNMEELDWSQINEVDHAWSRWCRENNYTI